MKKDKCKSCYVRMPQSMVDRVTALSDDGNMSAFIRDAIEAYQPYKKVDSEQARMAKAQQRNRITSLEQRIAALENKLSEGVE